MDNIYTKERLERTFNIYSVKDELTGAFHNPVFIETEPEAHRWFEYVVNTTGMWKNNPEQFTLWNIGTFNEHTGEVTTMTPSMVMSATSVVERS